MPEHATDRTTEQPFLHDLSCLLAAPMQAWTTADGSIEAGAGAQGGGNPELERSGHHGAISSDRR